jgi:hypothetical protein
MMHVLLIPELCRKGPLPAPPRCFCFTNVLCIPTLMDMGIHGLSREKKMHDVSEPYLILCWIISAPKLPSLAPIAAAIRPNDAFRAYFAWHSTFRGFKTALFD